MIDIDERGATDPPTAPGEPRRTPLRRILEEHPESRPRLVRAFAELIGATLVALVAVGGLLIWHIIRRGRLVRERLGPPRTVDLPEFPGRDPDQSS
jgi:hypothetical protein